MLLSHVEPELANSRPFLPNGSTARVGESDDSGFIARADKFLQPFPLPQALPSLLFLAGWRFVRFLPCARGGGARRRSSRSTHVARVAGIGFASNVRRDELARARVSFGRSEADSMARHFVIDNMIRAT